MSELLGVLAPIEVEHLKRQQEAAPFGHLVTGPWGTAFRCASCGAVWNASTFHPPPRQPHLLTAAQRRRDEKPWWDT